MRFLKSELSILKYQYSIIWKEKEEEVDKSKHD